MNINSIRNVVIGSLTALALVFMFQHGAQAQSTWVNPGTQSGYAAMWNSQTERFDLCWVDAHGHGNCMDVGEVYEIIRKAQNDRQQQLLEEMI